MPSTMEEDTTFFEKERDKLTGEITSGFEELLLSSNNLNRRLEEVLGMTREYETIAALWQSFHELMRGQKDEDEDVSSVEQAGGLPGTGARVLSAKGSTGPGQSE